MKINPVSIQSYQQIAGRDAAEKNKQAAKGKTKTSNPQKKKKKISSQFHRYANHGYLTSEGNFVILAFSIDYFFRSCI